MNDDHRYGSDYFSGRKFRQKPYTTHKTTFAIYDSEMAKCVDIVGMQTLDIACATGGYVSLCRKKGSRAVGIDISWYAIQQASRFDGEDFAQANVACPIPFANSVIGVVTAFDIIEHLDDPEMLLKESRRVLKSGGWLFLSTPNKLSFKRPLLGRNWNYDETHLRFYGHSELKAMLVQCGFNAVRVTCFTETRLGLSRPIIHVLDPLMLGDYLFAVARRP